MRPTGKEMMLWRLSKEIKLPEGWYPIIRIVRSIASMAIFRTRSKTGAKTIRLNLARVTSGFLQGRKQTNGGEPIGSIIFLFRQKLTMLSGPPHKMMLSWMNFTSPKQITISSRTLQFKLCVIFH